MEHIFVENLRCYIINTKLSEESWEYSSRKKKQEQASASEEAAEPQGSIAVTPLESKRFKSAAHYPSHECSVFSASTIIFQSILKEKKTLLVTLFPSDGD